MPRAQAGRCARPCQYRRRGLRRLRRRCPSSLPCEPRVPGQLVYIEQPEIHLHPRAQVAMARLLVNAAKRGVRVVAETHSSLILLAVQTLVAEGVIAPDLVGLNWFIRNQKTGNTRIETAELDAAGRFGDWPEDFDDVALKAESAYLSAAEDRHCSELIAVAKVPSRVLVIDASIARAAGDTSNHPTSRNCCDFLQAVLKVCHRMAMTDPLREEWNKHQSRFARTWRVSMMARRKVVFLTIPAHHSLKERIKRLKLGERVARNHRKRSPLDRGRTCHRQTCRFNR